MYGRAQVELYRKAEKNVCSHRKKKKIGIYYIILLLFSFKREKKKIVAPMLGTPKYKDNLVKIWKETRNSHFIRNFVEWHTKLIIKNEVSGLSVMQIIALLLSFLSA